MLILSLCLAASVSAQSLDTAGRPADLSLIGETPIRIKAELAGAKDNVEIAKLKDGSLVYLVKRAGTDTGRMLTPQEFTDIYYSQRNSMGWLATLFNITSPVGIAWVALGLGGQVLFTGRMLVQWFASEKSKRSVIPVSFWWMSLIGATMLLVYFIWRRDIVGILGQGAGWIVYIRNLMLIRRANHDG